MSRIEKDLMACINKTGTDGLGIPQSRVEELLQLLAAKMAQPSGSGSIANVFEDVSGLPENPDSQKIYRVTKLNMYIYDGTLINVEEYLANAGGSFIIDVVDSLPNNPADVIDQTTMTMHVYVLGNDIYGYNLLGDSQWLSNSELVNTTEMGAGYDGFITDGTTFTDGYVYLQYGKPEYININGTEKATFSINNEYKKVLTESVTISLSEGQVTYNLNLTNIFDLKLYNELKIIMDCNWNGNHFVETIVCQNKSTIADMFAGFRGLSTLGILSLQPKFGNDFSITGLTITFNDNGETVELQNSTYNIIIYAK